METHTQRCEKAIDRLSASYMTLLWREFGEFAPAWLVHEKFGQKIHDMYAETIQSLDAAMMDFLPCPGDPYVRHNGEEVEECETNDRGTDFLPQEFATWRSHDEVTLVFRLCSSKEERDSLVSLYKAEAKKYGTMLLNAYNKQFELDAKNERDAKFLPTTEIGIAVVDIFGSDIPPVVTVLDPSSSQEVEQEEIKGHRLHSVQLHDYGVKKPMLIWLRKYEDDVMYVRFFIPGQWLWEEKWGRGGRVISRPSFPNAASVARNIDGSMDRILTALKKWRVLVYACDGVTAFKGAPHFPYDAVKAVHEACPGAFADGWRKSTADMTADKQLEGIINYIGHDTSANDLH